MLVSQPTQIMTVAGTGEGGYAGDGGPARSACFNEPKAVALDSAGHLYIADAENHVIRKVDGATGVISTVAGQGEGDGGGESSRPPFSAHSLSVSDAEEDPLASPDPGTTDRYTQLRDLSGTVRFVVGSSRKSRRFAGDGGPATQALLHFPSSVAVDERGNLYIADTMNHRVRVVDAATGVITTLAGTGRAGFSGDGGPAVAASLNEPTCVVVDDRRRALFVADQSNHRVRRIDLETGLMSTMAGTGESGFDGDQVPAAQAALGGPSGLAVGPDGELYIADTFNSRIRRVDPVTGVIGTVAGDGGTYRYEAGQDGASANLSRPYGIAVDADGNLLITDSDSHLIRRWDRRTGQISLVAGNGMAGYAGDGGSPAESGLNYPFGVAVDARGDIFIADTFNHRIRKISSVGERQVER
jgi:DNA-binding beta-propeller fold protein YncE